ncbi:hypothetical protein B0J18DRAFT_407714 [Chaetomium sp. MPI-SDFR-AT-0129]|nr:hypothetical protein B0J18DRAFT_407714 [Chaetomium sp. MPI-SDFR-AT-0129]
MAEEPTLPVLPPSLGFDRRKRGRNGQSPPTTSSTSSDPAFFSSDDDPAIDNYQSHGRRKRRYVGSWFDQQPASSDSGVGEESVTPRARKNYPPPRRRAKRRSSSQNQDYQQQQPQQQQQQQQQPQKREFRRQLDSGVWLGTEGSLTDTDESFDIEPAASRLPFTPATATRVIVAPPHRVNMSMTRANRFAPTPWEEQAHRAIGFCVETGTEQVDLSGLDLHNVSDDMVERILEIEPIPFVMRNVAFEHRKPRYQLFLANNELRRFPPSLVQVEYLTVLSLRANALTRLSPIISKLVNLESLNIAQNFLTYLPGALLDLLRPGSKLQTLSLKPNRFWECKDTESNDGLPSRAALGEARGDEYDQLTYHGRLQPQIAHSSTWTGLTTKLHSRTPVQFMDSALANHSRFTLPPIDYARPGYDDEAERPRTAVHDADNYLPDADAASSSSTANSPAPLEIEPLTTLTTPKALDREAQASTTSLLTQRRGAPSLFEMAMRACVKSDQADYIINHWLTDPDFPSHFAPVARRALALYRESDAGGRRRTTTTDNTTTNTNTNNNHVDRTGGGGGGDGGIACDICGRKTLIPVTQWVEFRRIGASTRTVGAEGEVLVDEFKDKGVAAPVPFLRMGCSWACVPVRLEEREIEGVEDGEGEGVL